MISNNGFDPILSFQEERGIYRVEIYYESPFWEYTVKAIDVPKEVSSDCKVIKGREDENTYYKAMIEHLIPRVASRNGYTIMNAKDYEGPEFEYQKRFNKVLEVWEKTKHLYVVNQETKEVRLRDEVDVVTGQMEWVDIK